jgi:YHS domain-containing protein
LATQYLFEAAGVAPAADTGRHGMVGRDVWGWNYTTVLDVIALMVFAAILWLYRNRERFGGGAGYAKDPICGMQVETAHPGAISRRHGQLVYFCSDHCRERYERESAPAAKADTAVDPVCGMSVDPRAAAAHASYDGTDYYFCNPGCRDRFVAEPVAFLGARNT